MNIGKIKGHLQNRLTCILNTPVTTIQLTTVGGGSINDTYQLKTNSGKQFFLKLNSSSRFPGLFEKEKNGLDYLAKYGSIVTPEIILYEAIDDQQMLLLEWIEPGGFTDNFWKKFAKQLALLHQVTNTHFGFTEDNYIGSLAQLNGLEADWTDFFIRYRLSPQIELAAKNNLLESSVQEAFLNLFKILRSLFNACKPSLLHGDLWQGNVICNTRQTPVLIDPAVYFGHPAMDLAMTKLFGGFDKSFYEAYHYYSPLPSNYSEQWEICNLYPLLVHLNLFGKSYLPAITSTLGKFS